MKIFFGLIFFLACVMQAAAETSSCYTQTKKLQDFSATREKSGETTDFLKVIPLDDEKIRFELRQFGGNFHTCSVPGFALKQPDGTYIFKDEKQYWSEPGWELYGSDRSRKACEVHLKFADATVTITTLNSCNGFCGARGSFGGTLRKADNCDQFHL